MANFITRYPEDCQSDFFLSIEGLSRTPRSSNVEPNEVYTEIDGIFLH